MGLGGGFSQLARLKESFPLLKFKAEIYTLKAQLVKLSALWLNPFYGQSEL